MINKIEDILDIIDMLNNISKEELDMAIEKADEWYNEITKTTEK